jgi:kynurenine 3-monooxygenase
MIMSKDTKPVVLVGAGLAGSLLAVFMAKRGKQVQMYERRPDMRRESMGAGRSINLALSERGIRALKAVGLLEPIMKIAIPMKGRMMHDKKGNMTYQAYGKNDNEVIYSVSRGILNQRLMDLAEESTASKIHFNTRCTGMDLQSGTVFFKNESSGELSQVQGETVIGTDGSASALRMEMMKHGRFNFSQQYLEHGYKELTIPPDANGNFKMEPYALHIWPRGSFMMIALPNPDKSFTCTLFFPFAGDNGFDQLTDPDTVLTFFKAEFPDAVEMMPDLLNEFMSNPTSTLATVRCEPWFVGDKLALLGDASHAVVPFFGQGMNCSFEDCVIMNECMEAYGDDWSKVLSAYGNARKTQADAIADMALENFIEMRDKVADPAFLLRKKVEHALEEKYPEQFISRYAMVSFTNIPYRTAFNKGVQQDALLDALCKNIQSPDEIDWNLADQLMRNLK